MLKTFFFVICLAVGAALFAAMPTFAQDETTVYEDINIRVSYPDWPDIKNTLPSVSGIGKAVSNGECSFLLSVVPLDSGSFKGFVNQVIKEQTKQMKIKFSTKKIAVNSFDLDSIIKADGQNIRQYAHGIITPANVIYQFTFTSLTENYKDLCQPHIKPMLKSIKTIKPALSEKVNPKDFKKYFKELNFGSKPAGENNLNRFYRTNIIETDAAICFKGKVNKDIPEEILGIAIYNVDSGVNVKEEPVAGLIKKGNFTSCSMENLPAGQYEYKILVNGAAGAIYPFLVRAGASENATQPEATVDNTLSEQPDKNKFNKYFKSIYLGRLDKDKQVGPPDNMPIKTTAFTTDKDLFCIVSEIKKDVPNGSYAEAVYHVTTKEYLNPKSVFQHDLKQGGSAGCSENSWPVGKYEYKAYLDDILITVLPFEIK